MVSWELILPSPIFSRFDSRVMSLTFLRTNSVGGFDAQSFDGFEEEELKGSKLHPLKRSRVNKLNFCRTLFIILEKMCQLT